MSAKGYRSVEMRRLVVAVALLLLGTGLTVAAWRPRAKRRCGSPSGQRQGRRLEDVDAPLLASHRDAAGCCAGLPRTPSLRDPFRPVPPGFCTQVNGESAVALVTGVFRGRRVSTSFIRTDGCQIERWDRVRVLVPVRVP